MKTDWPTLAENEAHIWLINLVERHPVLLSPDEQSRADRFKIDTPRRQFTTARSALRLILGHYLDSAPLDIEFSYSEHGKPTIKHPENRLRFNVSHSGDHALIALTNDLPVGVDIECFERKTDFEALAKRFFSEAEQSRLSALPIARRQQSFLNFWTQKEAYLKALGTGLSRDTRSFTVAIDGGLVSDEREQKAPDIWSIRKLNPAPNYCAAIATPTPNLAVRQFTHTIDLHPPG